MTQNPGEEAGRKGERAQAQARDPCYAQTQAEGGERGEGGRQDPCAGQEERRLEFHWAATGQTRPRRRGFAGDGAMSGRSRGVA